MKRFSHENLTQLRYFVLISLVWFAIGWVLRSQFNLEEASLYGEVVQVLRRDSPGQLPSENELSLAAVKGMLQIIDDPYAVVIPPPSSLKFDADFAGETGVIGLVPNINEAGQMVVATVFEGGTAEAAGVQVGDILLSIDGIPVDASTTVTGSALLFRGPVGEPVELLIQRGYERLTFSPIREERIALEWRILENGTGYIAQHTFTTNVPALFDEALTAIMATNPPAVIWDVRSNGGGSMMVAQELLSNFVAEGELFHVLLKDGESRLFAASGDPAAPDVPLYVLVDEFTFSASETVAASIQETGRGTTVGNTTFGKGSVQNTVKLRDDHIFEYTIGYWTTPKGVAYEGSGFIPTVIAPDDPNTEKDETLEAALRLISEQNE